MARHKKDRENYLMIDHRHAAPVPDDVVRRAGLPVGAGRGLTEIPTYTCRHCQRQVIVNPDRKRERVWCRACDSYLCDTCAAHRAQTGECKTFDQVADEYLARHERGIVT